MEDEKSFKEKQLKSSETTMRRLNQDKEKRLQELEKINALDEKVQVLGTGGRRDFGDVPEHSILPSPLF